MKKQLFPTVLRLFLLLALAACTSTPTPETTTEPTAISEAAATETAPPPADTQAAPTEPPATEIQPTEPPPVPAGPTFNILGVVNRDITQAAFGPSVAVGATTAGAPPTAWITWVENFAPGSRQIFASEWSGEALQPRGASLNLHLNVLADTPSITFAGENAAVPWVVWIEPSPGFGDVANTFASRFNATSGLWQPAGQDRGAGEPSLNSQTNRPAAHSVITGGSGDPTLPPAPWVVWEELGRLSNFTQFFVSKGIKDDTGIGGFIWQLVGELRHNDEPTLNVDPFRHALHPSIIFAETGNAVPWVTWHEEGADRPSRIFTTRGVADAKVPGGFKWVFTPACNPDETGCSLNINPLKDAKDASMAAGSVTPGEATIPWIAWAEIGPTGKWQVFVSRLDPVSRASFVNVGGSLNVDPNQDARRPILVFVGNVPYVAWLEDDGTGNFRVHVRHLSSDPQTGTWTLDSPAGGFDHDPARSNSGLAVAATADTLFLAWVEGDPLAEVSQVILAQFKLAGAASSGGSPEPTVITGSGDITASVEQYRQLLGGIDNGGDAGSRGSEGYREINWDGVPDELSAPNFYPSDFFNSPESPRSRGIFLVTPGEGLMVSADSDNPTGTLPRFGNLNPQYADIFKTFSAERLFSPVGSNVVNVTFFVPGTNTPAAVRGFGAVYTDVDTDHTAFEYFDKDGNSLGSFQTPLSGDGLSFLGVVFDEAIIFRIEVRYGTGALGPNDGDGGVDVAVMDNFIYGEPQALP